MSNLLISTGVRAAAERSPDKIALHCAGGARSYRDLARRIGALGWLARTRLGLARGERVALLAPNCIEYIEWVCGLSEAGVIVATLNPRSAGPEVLAACRDCAARALVFHPQLASLVAALDWAEAPTVRERLRIDWADVDAAAAAGRELPSIDVKTEDPFALVYSSGTTGRPKGIVLPHRSRVQTFHAMAREYGCFGAEDRFLAVAPLAHGAGFAFALAPLWFGGYVEILPRFDAAQVLDKLAHGGFTGVFLVPTHFHSLFALPHESLDSCRGRFGTLRAIISNAAALPQATKERIVEYFGPGLLHESYGSTEAGIVTNLRPADQLTTRQCVGAPFGDNEIRLLDDSGREVGVGEVGELYSRSSYLFSGYWQNEAETRAAVRDGWVSAGDLARRDARGLYYIVDRKKDMVISGGINIYPREIEEVLQQHPDVREAAVIGVPDPRWGERLRAFIVTRAGPADPSDEALIEFCRGRLADYKIPREFRRLSALPRNVGGK
ncbi:MAG: AMP-binding protein, partial [Steroidobacteraceae bacterium]|nr:AMP-binding protein [Steroidobacteraceae bacterium]